nr:hypothetical protein TSUD_191170 [Tanacetum cinerariifolium]
MSDEYQANSFVITSNPAGVKHLIPSHPTRSLLYLRRWARVVRIRRHLSLWSEDCPLKEEGKTSEKAYYTQFRVPFPQGGRCRASTPGFYQRENGNPLYQKRRQTMEESMGKIMADSANRHDENSNLIKEIRAVKNASIRNQKVSIKALEIQIRKMSKDKTIKRPKGMAENVLVGIDKFVFPVDFVVLDMPKDIKVSLILE